MDKKSKMKKIWIPVSSVIVILAVVSIIVIPRLIRENKYNAAMQLFNANAFSQSAVQFAELDEYKDSVLYLHYSLMREDILTNRFGSALDREEKLGDFLDTPQYVQYAKAKQNMESGDYETAIAAFEAAGDILDAKNELNSCIKLFNEECYQSALVYMAMEDWPAARELFIKATGYLDSDGLAGECQDNWYSDEYDRAISMIMEGDEEAITVLSVISTYKNSHELSSYCMDGEIGYRYSQLLIFPPKTPRESALAYFALGDYRDAAVLAAEYKEEADELDYQKALSAAQSKDWNEAISVFESIRDYKDVEMQLLLIEFTKKEELYIDAVSLEDDGYYKDAIMLYDELGTYKDSPIRLIICRKALENE